MALFCKSRSKISRSKCLEEFGKCRIAKVKPRCSLEEGELSQALKERWKKGRDIVVLFFFMVEDRLSQY